MSETSVRYSWWMDPKELSRQCRAILALVQPISIHEMTILNVLLMEEILHHLECIKPCKLVVIIYHPQLVLAGFLPSTVWKCVGEAVSDGFFFGNVRLSVEFDSQNLERLVEFSLKSLKPRR